MLLVNARSDETIASEVELALTRPQRRRGLLGRNVFAAAAALVISPCWSIHTAFMSFPIDLIFVDPGGRVMRIVQNLAPWRIAVAPRAYAVIELPAGSLARQDLRIGDEIRLVPPPAQHLNVLRSPALTVWNRTRVEVSTNMP
jgi:uncharacterized membrane protein (UPF0127 family)